MAILTGGKGESYVHKYVLFLSLLKLLFHLIFSISLNDSHRCGKYFWYWLLSSFLVYTNFVKLFSYVFPGEEGIGGGGGSGGKIRQNSADKNIREYFSKHPSSSPVRLAGAKSPSPQGANYPMVSFINNNSLIA